MVAKIQNYFDRFRIFMPPADPISHHEDMKNKNIVHVYQ